MSVPLISIITVTYNAENELRPTLESVASQSFTDYEHLIIDGASSDGTLALLSRWQSPRMQVHSKPDNGIYHGMNRGLKYAEGKYVLFLNAGDSFASSDTLAKYAEAAREGADIIYGDTVIVDNNRKILAPRHLSAPKILTYKSFLGGMLICHQAFMVRRDIAPLYNTDYKLSADYDWCLASIAASGVTRRVNLNAVTIHYLQGGISQKKKIASLKERFLIMKRRFGMFAAIKAHLSFIPRALSRKF